MDDRNKQIYKMDDYSKQICRLCLHITPSCECKAIDEIKKEILEVLLVNIDFDISGDVVACNRCVERVQNLFNFKSHCIATHMNVINEKIYMERSQICHLCMSMFEVNTSNYTTYPDLKEEVSFKEIIGNYFPEVDSTTVGDPLLCNSCQGRVREYYELMRNFEKIEQRINNYWQVESHGTVGRIILKDLLKFEEYEVLGEPTIIKKEYPDVESIDANIKKEENSIQSGEVHIKDEELDNGMEKRESGQVDNYDDAGKNGASKKKKTIKNISEGKRHFCPKCPYSAKYICKIKCHMRHHSDKEVHRCKLCSFVTDAKLSLRAHMTSHRGLSMAYSCSECTYETNVRCHLVNHLLKHKDKSEVEMQKCSLCSYETKYKSALMTHRKHLHGRNVKVHECKSCFFSTTYKAHLSKHELTHKNPEEIPKLKCAKCEFETKHKGSLIMHMTRHDDAVKIFQCEKCPFQSKWNVNVKKHVMVHSDQHILRCDECIFSTKDRFSLGKHKHNIHSKMDHWAPMKEYRHVSEDKPILKCELCPYMTWEKLDLCNHSVVHEETIHKCDLSAFRPKLKSNLKQHRLKNMEPEETTMYFCATCDFRTKYKQALGRHVPRCLKTKKI